MNAVRVLVFLMLILLSSTRADIFSSTAHMEAMLAAESDLLDKLEEYVVAKSQKLQRLKQFANYLTSDSISQFKTPEHVRKNEVGMDVAISDPISAFLLVQEMYGISTKLQSVFKEDATSEIIEELVKLHAGLPEETDYKGTVKALFRLQDTYSLSAHSLSQGIIGGVETGAQLSAKDCYDIGQVAYQEKDVYHAAIWFQEARVLHERTLYESKGQEHSKPDFSIAEVKEKLQKCLTVLERKNKRKSKKKKCDDGSEAAQAEGFPEPSKTKKDKNSGKPSFKLADEQLADKIVKPSILDNNELNKLNEPILATDTIPINMQAPQIKRPRDDSVINDFSNLEKYEMLCRGEFPQRPVSASVHKCYLTNKGSPWLELQPVKEEVIQKKPFFLALYHDVINDDEIETVKELAMPKLNRATVGQGASMAPASYRISKSAWLSDDAPISIKLNDRIRHITGLDLETAELLQVGNYGIGGHYEPHYDHNHIEDCDGVTSKYDDKDRNRVATFMYYLSDVKAGGATVFPHRQIRVLPIKKAGIFWYNMSKSGCGIQKTRHAGCPVLLGSKWVINKWIHEGGQEFTRPCGLTKDE